MSKEKIFLISKKELIENINFIYDDNLRESFYNFTKNKSGNIHNLNFDAWKDLSYDDRQQKRGGILTTKGLPSYQDFLNEKRFEDILDDFITGLLSMTSNEKNTFLKFFDVSLPPKSRQKTEPKHIYNIINDRKKGSDIFESIKVSYLERTNKTILSSYNIESIERIKLRLIKEGIDVISYRIVKNPHNDRDIHSIMY